jgi:hypothetical protein
MRGFGFPLMVLTALVTLLLADGPQRPVSADEDERQLPPDCSSGELVVYEGFGEFECVSPFAALGLGGCDSGDFVTVEYGSLKCVGREEYASASHALLPSCSSGETLVSEGSGQWDCASRDSAARAVLPSCSSGQILVSESGGGWRCADRD